MAPWNSKTDLTCNTYTDQDIQCWRLVFSHVYFVNEIVILFPDRFPVIVISFMQFRQICDCSIPGSMSFYKAKGWIFQEINWFGTDRTKYEFSHGKWCYEASTWKQWRVTRNSSTTEHVMLVSQLGFEENDPAETKDNRFTIFKVCIHGNFSNIFHHDVPFSFGNQ